MLRIGQHKRFCGTFTQSLASVPRRIGDGCERRNGRQPGGDCAKDGELAASRVADSHRGPRGVTWAVPADSDDRGDDVGKGMRPAAAPTIDASMFDVRHNQPTLSNWSHTNVHAKREMDTRQRDLDSLGSVHLRHLR